MTRAEALIFLPLGEQDELIDLFEDQFFLVKKKILNAPLFPKILYGKLDQAKNLELAFHVLGGTSAQVRPQYTTIETPLFAGALLEQFDAYSEARNKVKLLIHQAESHSELSLATNGLLALQNQYAQQWDLGKDVSLEGVLLSAEPDSMRIREALIELNHVSGRFCDWIRDFPEDHFLLREAKRLTLYLIKVSNE